MGREQISQDSVVPCSLALHSVNNDCITSEITWRHMCHGVLAWSLGTLCDACVSFTWKSPCGCVRSCHATSAAMAAAPARREQKHLQFLRLPAFSSSLLAGALTTMNRVHSKIQRDNWRCEQDLQYRLQRQISTRHLSTRGLGTEKGLGWSLCQP